MRQFAVVVRLVAFLWQPCVKRKTAAKFSRDYLAAFVRQTQGLIDNSPTLTPCKFVGQSCVHLEAALRLPCDLRTSLKNRKENEHVANYPYDVATALRLAKRKMVLRLRHEIPKKCVRRQVYGCRKADVKRALVFR